MRNIVVFSLLAVVLFCVSQAGASPIVLKEYNAAGYTFCNVSDTKISSYGTDEMQYNFGGETAPNNLYATMRPFLIRFDLNAIPDKVNIVSVNSATLRVYRIARQFDNRNIGLAQMAQDWVEGTSDGSWAGACDGANWYARNAGTVVANGSLVSAGGGVYYTDGVSSLADDPINVGKKYVRLAGINYNNAQNAYTGYATLADLQAAGGTRGYYWDSAAGRLYLNRNDQNVRWYGAADMWSTPGGGVVDGYANDKAAPAAPPVPGWVEWDASGILTNWLVGGQGNYGFRIIHQTSCDDTFATSDYTADLTLRPELVLDVTYTPEPATLGLLLLGGLSLLRRRD